MIDNHRCFLELNFKTVAHFVLPCWIQLTLPYCSWDICLWVKNSSLMSLGRLAKHPQVDLLVSSQQRQKCVGGTQQQLTSYKLCSCKFRSGKEVIQGTLFSHGLKIKSTPIIAIAEFTCVQLWVKHRRVRQLLSSAPYIQTNAIFPKNVLWPWGWCQFF